MSEEYDFFYPSPGEKCWGSVDDVSFHRDVSEEAFQAAADLWSDFPFYIEPELVENDWDDVCEQVKRAIQDHEEEWNHDNGRYVARNFVYHVGEYPFFETDKAQRKELFLSMVS